MLALDFWSLSILHAYTFCFSYHAASMPGLQSLYEHHIGVYVAGVSWHQIEKYILAMPDQVFATLLSRPTTRRRSRNLDRGPDSVRSPRKNEFANMLRVHCEPKVRLYNLRQARPLLSIHPNQIFFFAPFIQRLLIPLPVLTTNLYWPKPACAQLLSSALLAWRALQWPALALSMRSKRLLQRGASVLASQTSSTRWPATHLTSRPWTPKLRLSSNARPKPNLSLRPMRPRKPLAL